MEEASDEIVRWRCDDTNLLYVKGMVNMHATLYGVKRERERLEEARKDAAEKKARWDAIFEEAEKAGAAGEELEEAFEKKNELKAGIVDRAAEKMAKIEDRLSTGR